MTFKQALDDSKLIYSVLARAGISQYHPDFEDYVQECLLIYVQLEQEFTNKIPNDPVSRAGFFFVRLYCRLVDKLRHDKYYQVCDPDMTQQPELVYNDLNYELVTLLEELKQRLKVKEYRFLEMAYGCELPLPYICQELNISRRTAFRFQQTIRETARQLNWEKQ